MNECGLLKPAIVQKTCTNLNMSACIKLASTIKDYCQKTFEVVTLHNRVALAIMVEPRVKRQRNFYTINEFSRTKICFPNSKMSIHHFAQIYAAATPNIIKMKITGDHCHGMVSKQSVLE